MTGFKTAFSAEMKKAAGRKKVKAALFLCLLAVVIGTTVCAVAGNFMGINLTGRAELSLILLPVFTKLIIPLFTLFMCIDIFSGEYSSGTMKTTLLTGATRFEIFFAKAALLAVFVLLMLAFSFVSSFAASVIVGKTTWSVIRVVFSYALSAIPLMSFAFMCMFVCTLIKGSGAAFMISVLFYIAEYVLSLIFPELSALFFTDALDVYVLLSSPLLGMGKIIRALLISVGYSALFSGLGLFLFEKKEL